MQYKDVYELLSNPEIIGPIIATTAINGIRVAATTYPITSATITTVTAAKLAYDVYYDENQNLNNVLSSYYQNDAFKIVSNAALAVASMAGAANILMNGFAAAASFVGNHPYITTGIASLPISKVAYDAYVDENHPLTKTYYEYQNYIDTAIVVAELGLAATGVIYSGAYCIGKLLSLSYTSLTLITASAALATKFGVDIYYEENQDPINIASKYANYAIETSSNLFDFASSYAEDITISPRGMLWTGIGLSYASIGSYCAFNFAHSRGCQKIYNFGLIAVSQAYNYMSNLISEISPNAVSHLHKHMQMVGIAWGDPHGDTAFNFHSAAVRYGLDSAASSAFGDIMSNYFPYTLSAAIDTTMIGPGIFIYNLPINHPIIFATVTTGYLLYKAFGDGSYDICTDTPICFGFFAPQMAIPMGSINLIIQSAPFMKEVLMSNPCSTAALIIVTTASAALTYYLISDEDETYVIVDPGSEVTGDNRAETTGNLVENSEIN